MPKQRIAYARIAQETNAFSPEPTTLDHFRRLHWLEGDALAKACGRGGREIPNLIANAELSGVLQAARRAKRRSGDEVEAVPLFSAWALPAGPIADDAFEHLRDRLAASLRAAGRVDGVVLSLHGAMRGSATYPEPEDTLLHTVREVVGPDLPLAATYDLHANLTAAKATVPTVIAGYRSNPHWDLAWTGRRAARMLIDTIAGRLNPTAAWRKLPMVLGGGITIDFVPPMLPIFARMRWLEVRRRVVDASLFMAHIWNDSTTLGWATYAVTNGDEVGAARHAEDLAERAWATRHVQPPTLLDPGSAVDRARKAGWARKAGVVCLSDVSDNCGAGAPGDSPHLLRAFLEGGAPMTCLVAVRDAAATAVAAQAGVGATVALEVGGSLSPQLHPPTPLEGTVIHVGDTPHFGPTVTVAAGPGGHVKCVLTQRAPINVKPRFWTDAGLNPWQADIIAVKSLFHFRIYYAPMMRLAMGVRTPGVTDLALWETVDYDGPTHPRDEVPNWRARDAVLRAV